MSKFKPVAIPPVQPSVNEGRSVVTATVNLKGKLGEEFENMVNETNQTRSGLLRQMVLFCLGYEEELESMRRSTK